MTVILILIRLKLQCSILVLISSFAKNANLSNDIFRDETIMHPRAMQVQQNRQKCHAVSVIPPQKSENSKTRSISFFIHSCSTKCVALSVDIITSHCLWTHTQTSQHRGHRTAVSRPWCCRAVVCNHAAMLEQNGNDQIGPRPTAACVKLCMLDNALTTHGRYTQILIHHQP